MRRDKPTVSTSCPASAASVLTLNVGALQATLDTPTLSGAQIVPFASNSSVSSSGDGKVHTFNWSFVPVVDSVRINVWDRSQIRGGGAAQFVRSRDFVGTTTSFVIDLNEPASPFFNDRPYTLEVSLIDTRDNNVVAPHSINIL